jgi:hypothetical protein
MFLLLKIEQVRMVQKDTSFFITALLPWFIEQAAGHWMASVA